MRENQSGFTLLEVMLVIGIIAILASVLIPRSAPFKSMALESGVEANQHTVEALVNTLIYEWGDGDYRYGDDETGVSNLEDDIKDQINPAGVTPDSDLENPVTKSKGMVLATKVGGAVSSFPGGAVAYASGSDQNEWPAELKALRGAVGVSAFIEGGKIKVKLVAYDSNGIKFHDDITIVRH